MRSSSTPIRAAATQVTALLLLYSMTQARAVLPTLEECLSALETYDRMEQDNMLSYLDYLRVVLALDDNTNDDECPTVALTVSTLNTQATRTQFAQLACLCNDFEVENSIFGNGNIFENPTNSLDNNVPPCDVECNVNTSVLAVPNLYPDEYGEQVCQAITDTLSCDDDATVPTSSPVSFGSLTSASPTSFKSITITKLSLC